MQLYLNSYGTYLHVKDALFEVRIPDGKQTKTHHFAAKKVKTIVMTVAAALSTDAIRLAIRNNVDLIFAERSGFPIGRVWHARPGSTTKIRKEQLAASLDHRASQWTIRWVSEKMQRQAELLRRLKKHRNEKASAMLAATVERIEGLTESVKILGENQPPIVEIAPSIRGLEGTAGRLYFQALSSLLPEKHRFERRSFRPAKDAFNAFLNYGYGVLYSRTEKCLMVAGIDQFTGFMHRDDYNQKSMLYDFIEPYRCWVDKVVFGLFSRKMINTTHYEITSTGVFLEKPAKELLIEKLNHYLEEERVLYRRRKLTRASGMQYDAHYFANQLIGNTEFTELEITQL